MEKMNREQYFAVSHNTDVEKHQIKYKSNKIKKVLLSGKSSRTQPQAAVAT